MIKLFALSFLFILPFFGISQHFIGLEAGYLGSNLVSKPTTLDFKIHSGLSGGINYTYQGVKKMTIHSGIKVQQFGHDFNLVLTDEFGVFLQEGRVQNRIMSVNIPIKVGYKFGSRFTITPSLGFSAKGILSANSVLPKSLTGLGSLAKSTTFLDQINQFNVSAVVATEFATKIKEAQVFAHLEYQQGLLNTFKDGFIVEGSSHKHLTLGLIIGFRLQLFQKIVDEGIQLED